MFDENQEMISVIIPVYNSEKYLHKCIDSVLSQSYTNLELILVNDGSTDSSGMICDEYAEKDERVRVFHKENGGVSSARNLGLENATGEWISFVDSDDWEDRATYKAIIDSIIDKKVDLVIWGLKFAYKSYEKEVVLGNCVFANQKTNIQELLIQCDMKGLLGSPCNKLYLLSHIKNNNLQFDANISNNEDVQFNCQYLRTISGVYCHNKIFYNYRKDDNRKSLSNTYPDNLLEIVENSIRMKRELFSSYNGYYRDIYDAFLDKSVYGVQLQLLLDKYNRNISAKKRRGYWRNFLNNVEIIYFKDVWFYVLLKTNNVSFIDVVFKLRYLMFKYFEFLTQTVKKIIYE